jgi:hypothetical protein
MKKHAALRGVDAPLRVQDAFDHVIFHSPYNKLVQQSFQRMLFNDARRLAAVSLCGKGIITGVDGFCPMVKLSLLMLGAQAGVELPEELKGLEPYLQLPAAATYSNKDLDKALKAIPTSLYERLVRSLNVHCAGSCWLRDVLIIRCDCRWDRPLSSVSALATATPPPRL